MTLQRHHWLHNLGTSGAAVALGVGLFGCTPSDDDTTGQNESETTDPTEASNTSPESTDTGMTTEPATSTGVDPDTGTDDTSATTGPHHMVECPTPGTMTWDGDVYIFEAEHMTLLDGYNVVTGDIKISMPAIDNLDFLACVTEVQGDVQIFGTTAPDVAGLANITSIGKSLSISENPNLTAIYGLDQLTDLGGSFIVTKNNALTSVEGVSALQIVGLSVNIDQNPVLTDITAFSGLVAITQNLSISYNDVLVNLAGLHDLKAIGMQLLITGNPSLCISEVMEVGADLKMWSGDGDTTGNKEDC